MPGTCLIIANPISGSGRGRRDAPGLEAGLRRNGFGVELFWTDAPGAARSAAEAADPEQVSVILSVGGDGTLNEVANGVGDKNIPIALFPTGTANVLAQEYGIPPSVERVCEIIAAGKTVRLDVGLAAGRRFVLFIGAGYDAAVVAAVAAKRTGRITKLHYVGPVLKALATYRFPEMEVVVDDQAAGRATSALVCNVHSYGGPFEIAEGADPTDGLFDVCLLRGRRRRDMVRYFWGGMRHRLFRYQDTARLRGKVIELRCPAAVPLQADGDFVGELPVRIELLRARLPILVP